MPEEIHRSVRAAPSKPLLVFDGDCHFCRRWIERWRVMTAGAVEYAPFQEAAGRFPEIPREAFEKSVQFIETNGAVYNGAEAVFRSLGHKAGWRWMDWAHQHLPGFKFTTEAVYALVARNRQVASFLTRLLWGNDVRPPTYFWARRWFVRGLGGIYLIAFLSLWVQVDGLIGAKGILPVAEYLSAARDQLGGQAWFQLPTLCWLDSSDLFLHFLCGAGAVLSVLLMAGFFPVVSLILLFLLYLSLTIAGQTFLSFQWDILLLEAGFLAIFFAPKQLWPRWRRLQPEAATAARVVDPPVSRLGLFLLKLLLFKLMLMSGVVKLTSGDDSWWNLTALDYHYWTQPLPTVMGWWAHQGPEWLRKFSTFFVLFVETTVPFFIWAPRRLRHIAGGLLILLQILIALTGNYCFFNLLTIALCLLLIDDALFPGVDSTSRASDRTDTTNKTYATPVRRSAAIGLLLVLVPLNTMLVVSAFKPPISWPRPVAWLYGWVEPFRIVNGYGLFRVMTKSRLEIVIEGSADGERWSAYQFRWKPENLSQRPRWVAPHQPRLDWQMWFAALGTYRNNPWFVSLAGGLLRNNPEITRLLAHNPFPEGPPRYLRAMLYDYHFTSVGERRATGDWWKREEKGEYLPVISLR